MSLRSSAAALLLAASCSHPAPPSPPVVPDVPPLVALAAHLHDAPITSYFFDQELRIQGQRPAPRAAELVRADVAMFDRLRTTGALRAVLADPDFLSVLRLCHSLIETAPATGLACLREMHDADRANATLGVEHHTFITYLDELGLAAAGRDGELLAVELACRPDDTEYSAMAALYLDHHAIYGDSIPAIDACLANGVTPVANRGFLIDALGHIGSPAARPSIDRLMAMPPTDDYEQAQVVWSFTELYGHAGIARLEAVHAVGPKTTAALAEGLGYLRSDTTDASPFGLETANDREFLDRFSDLRTPVMQFAGTIPDVLAGARALTPAEKHAALAALRAGGAFGLDAIKGSLFAVVDAGDVPALLELRQLASQESVADRQATGQTVQILVKRARTR